MPGQDHRQNPFVGLRPFESENSLYYFGRNAQTKALLKQLYDNRFLAVIGSSGCGKSSLVRAGLISNLEAGFLVQDRDVWWVAKMKPGEAPLANLARALLEASGANSSPEQCAAFKERIQNQGIPALLKEFKAALDSADANCFLLADQFEELFRFAGDRANYEEAADFVAILQQMAEQTEAPFFVCLTMRSDFLGDCDRFSGLPEAMNRSQYLVPRLTRQQRREAITGPAHLLRANVASRLLDRLLNEEMDTRDDLPILQHALMRTWEEWVKEGDGEIDVEPYERIHTVKRALSVHADEALGELSEADQSLAKQMFQTLTETDAGNRRLRRPARLGEIAEACGTNNEKVRSIVEKFREKGRNFLVLSAAADPNNALVDISHESLIRQWDRLRGWVDEEAESAKLYRRLAETAELHRQGRAGLYRDADLQIALTWQEKQKPSPAWAKRYGLDFGLVIEFLQASKRKRKEDQAAALLAQQQQREFGRVRKQRAWAYGLVGAFALLMFLAGGLALYASKQREAAKKAEEIAVANADKAEKSAKREADEASNARKNLRLAESNAALARIAETKLKDNYALLSIANASLTNLNASLSDALKTNNQQQIDLQIALRQATNASQTALLRLAEATKAQNDAQKAERRALQAEAEAREVQKATERQRRIALAEGLGMRALVLTSGDRLSESLPNPKNVTDLSYRIVDTGDFSGDGTSDILLQNSDGQLAIRLMDEFKSTSAPDSGLVYLKPKVPEGWRAVFVGDFNKDGKIDIFFQDPRFGNLGIWLMNGTNYIGAEIVSRSLPSYRLFGTGDFNGDGKLDLVFQDDMTGLLSIWFMDGTKFITSGFTAPERVADIDWRAVGTIDLNQDGKVDLLFRNRVTGSAAIWYMNGTNKVSITFLKP